MTDTHPPSDGKTGTYSLAGKTNKTSKTDSDGKTSKDGSDSSDGKSGKISVYGELPGVTATVRAGSTGTLVIEDTEPDCINSFD